MPPKAKSGNPLFLEWAEEIQRAAASAGLQSAQSYRKAVASIRACPIPYARPAQLVSLSSVGPKLIDQLYKRQKLWCEERGIEVPGLDQGSDEDWWIETRGSVPVAASTSREERNDVADDYDQEMSGLLGVGLGNAMAGPSNPRKRKITNPSGIVPAPAFSLFSDEAAGPDHPTTTIPKKRKTAGAPDPTDLDPVLKSSTSKTKSTPKEKTTGSPKPKPKVKKMYIPKERSGAYAILIALVSDLPFQILAQGVPRAAVVHDEVEGDSEADQSMDALTDTLSHHTISRSDLIERAQPHCSSSFTTSETGSAKNGNFYNAWSNMKSLLEKGYVGSRGNPKKFWLTAEGFRSGLGLWKTAFPEEARALMTYREKNGAGAEHGPVGGSTNAVAGPSRSGEARERDPETNDPNRKKAQHQSRSPSASRTTARRTTDLVMSDDDDIGRPPIRPGPTQRLRSSSPDISMEDFGDDDIAAAEVLEREISRVGRALGSSPMPPNIAAKTLGGQHEALMRAQGSREKSRGQQAVGGGLAGLHSARSNGRATGFTFWYLGHSPLQAEDGNQVLTRDKAKCRLDELIHRPMFLVRLDVRELVHPLGKALRHVKQSKGSGTIFEGYMMEKDAPERCTAGCDPAIDAAPVARGRVRSGQLQSSSVVAPLALPSGFDFGEGYSPQTTTSDPTRARPVPPIRLAVPNIERPLRAAAPTGRTTSKTYPPWTTEARNHAAFVDGDALAMVRPQLQATKSAVPLGSPPLAAPPGLSEFRSSPSHIDLARSGAHEQGRAVNVGNSRLLGLENPSSTRTPSVLALTQSDAIDLSELDDAQIASPRPLAVSRDSTWGRTVSAPEPRGPVPPKHAQAGPSRIMPRFSSAMPVHSPVMEDTSAVPQPVNGFVPSEAVRFPAGSFDVILLMDTREIKSKRDEQLIVGGLLQKGILVETRMLSVGDMCWIARSRSPVGCVTECVLDYVCERKRLDDLLGSIQDGRFEEQKYRLANSCLRHVYYIVEDWDLKILKEQTGLAIATAKSQTQITNGFFLKDTHKLSETIDYLRMMTMVIKQAHEFETLHIIPDRYISRPTYTKLQRYLRHAHPSKPFYTTYDTYQDINGKNSCRTLRDVFAKMLLRIKGMSAERVGAVLNVWETPAEMWQAFEARRAEIHGRMLAPKERGLDLFFADAVVGEGRQKIGDALSREMYAVFCQ